MWTEWNVPWSTTSWFYPKFLHILWLILQFVNYAWVKIFIPVICDTLADDTGYMYSRKIKSQYFQRLSVQRNHLELWADNPNNLDCMPLILDKPLETIGTLPDSSILLWCHSLGVPNGRNKNSCTLISSCTFGQILFLFTASL